jgi:hypothetical protein
MTGSCGFAPDIIRNRVITVEMASPVVMKTASSCDWAMMHPIRILSELFAILAQLAATTKPANGSKPSHLMSSLLDHILVVDVESTCWDGQPPPDQISEIVEIGLCVVDVATLARVERRSILVRPVRSTVSAFCTQLTTLTQADVDAGMPLAEGCQLLGQDYRSGFRQCNNEDRASSPHPLLRSCLQHPVVR